jgi:hypothetical protein
MLLLPTVLLFGYCKRHCEVLPVSRDMFRRVCVGTGVGVFSEELKSEDLFWLPVTTPSRRNMLQVTRGRPFIINL